MTDARAGAAENGIFDEDDSDLAENQEFDRALSAGTELLSQGNATEARNLLEKALRYMDLVPGTPLEGIAIDRVFIGSCTNSRLEDLTAAARIAKGHKVASGVRAMVVPGSQKIKQAAEQQGESNGSRELYG